MCGVSGIHGINGISGISGMGGMGVFSVRLLPSQNIAALVIQYPERIVCNLFGLFGWINLDKQSVVLNAVQTTECMVMR